MKFSQGLLVVSMAISFGVFSPAVAHAGFAGTSCSNAITWLFNTNGCRTNSSSANECQSHVRVTRYDFVSVPRDNYSSNYLTFKPKIKLLERGSRAPVRDAKIELSRGFVLNIKPRRWTSATGLADFGQDRLQVSHGKLLNVTAQKSGYRNINRNLVVSHAAGGNANFEYFNVAAEITAEICSLD